MRCEVCGAPVSEGHALCDLCRQRGIGSRYSTPVPPRPAAARATEDYFESSPGLEHTSRRGSSPLSIHAQEGPKPGQVTLEGKYRLLTELGRGAMGTVFLAEDIALRRRVAVKFLLPQLAESVDCAQRFRQEAVGMAAVHDNNVVQIYTYGEHGGTPYFVMEYLEGETLESLIDAHNARGFYVPLRDALDMLVEAISGLCAIHQAGAVHRDLKPGNIILAGDPTRCVIMDFGLVRMVQVDEKIRALAGTPAYIAPELVEGKPGADRSILTDIYSMGATAYELLTGTLPFNGETWVEILRKHISQMPAFPSERRPGLPAELDDILMRALSKDPNARYQSAQEVLDDLLEVRQTVEAEPARASLVPTGLRDPLGRSSSRPPLAHRASRAGVRKSTGGGRGRLLVVDTDANFRNLVHGTAKAVVPGCRVSSATDGELALEMIESVRPHVLISELQLPGINGIELVATVRGDDANKEMQIVVVSQNMGRVEVDILRKLRVDHILTKPVDSDELAEMLRPMLERAIGQARSSFT